MFRFVVLMKGDTGEVTIGSVAKVEERGQYDEEGNIVASYLLSAIAGYRREPLDE